MNTEYADIIIIGGGLVGMTLAHALTGHGLQLALIDTKPLPSEPPQDNRALALSYASQQILTTLGLWQSIVSQATNINAVHVSRTGLLAKTHMRARDVSLPTLGAVVPAGFLAIKMAEPLAAYTDLKIIAPATVTAVKIKEKVACVTLQQAGQIRSLSAKLIIAADGSSSYVAEQLNIYQQTYDYQQVAIVSVVTTDQPNAGNAYERFTEQGVIALLPLHEQQFGVVWTVAAEYAPTLLALSSAEYCLAVQRQLPYYLGHTVSMGERFSYPLKANNAAERIRPRCVLLGNAAHTLHPVAAQGLNLALRSVAWLAEILLAAKTDVGELSVLQAYQEQTERDIRLTQISMHSLVALSTQLTNTSLWSLGLRILDTVPVIKRAFMRRATGVAGYSAKLVRGVKLHDD